MATEKSVAEALTGIEEALRIVATADFTAQVLLDYSFEALDVNHRDHYLLHGNTPRRGRWVLYSEGVVDAFIRFYGMIWQPQGKPNKNVSYLQFFGNGNDQWSSKLPGILDGKSIYIYVEDTDTVYEIPYSGKTFHDSYRLGFDSTARPEGVYTGSTLRVIVAGQDQRDDVYAWIARGGQMAQMERLPEPPPPSLSAENGGVTVAIPDSYVGRPVLAWHFWYRESGTPYDKTAYPDGYAAGATYVDVLGNKPQRVTGLTANRDYDFGITVMNQGGKSLPSDKATIRCI